MNDRTDRQLETLLRDHFASKLDSQLGRSAERFMREVGETSPPAPHMRLVGGAPVDRHRRLRLFGWSAGFIGAAVAAGIAIVMIFTPTVPDRRGANAPELVYVDPMPVPDGSSDPRGDETVTAVDNSNAQNVEHALTWNTIDQGTVYVADDVPLRSVVRQANETVRWYDPQRKAHMELTVPRDEVMFVGYQSQ